VWICLTLNVTVSGAIFMAHENGLDEKITHAVKMNMFRGQVTRLPLPLPEQMQRVLCFICQFTGRLSIILAAIAASRWSRN
jgi:hypothetical protein